MRALWLLLTLQACLVPQAMIDKIIDSDNDGHWEVGYHDGGDCDDENPAINPDQAERCLDRVDNDCDGLVDEDGVGEEVIYADRDGDSFGDPATFRAACYVEDGWVLDSADCDDRQADVSPTSPEQCNGEDDDCDGEIDNNAPGLSWFPDSDGDGWGDPATVFVVCGAPLGTVGRADDCDDARFDVHPGAADAWYDGVDADCDGADDFDQDADGWQHASAAPPNPDCDDTQAAIYPGAPEVWYDDVDEDCAASTEWDQDADGFDAAVAGGPDCDDHNLLIRPDADEVWYDGVDQDCRPDTEWDADGDGHTRANAPVGTADDCDDANALVGPPEAFYPDLDGDHWGAAVAPFLTCRPPGAWVTNDDDCDDNDPTLSPETPWYLDVDADGFGDANAVEQACYRPIATVRIDGDCDDTLGSVHPGATEACDAVDQDCDGQIDEGWLTVQYPDEDGDGYASGEGESALRCPDDPAWSAFSGDCAPGDPDIHPGAVEACDGVDATCNGDGDEGLVTRHRDADGDGAGDPVEALVCPGSAGYLEDASDCDDVRASVRPGLAEVCDHLDNDCDTVVDDGVTVDLFEDGDGDGVGAALFVAAGCAVEFPALVATSGDCDDRNSAFYPGAPEACDHRDGNCSGTDDDDYAIEGFYDEDCDGYAFAATSVALCEEETLPQTTDPCDESVDHLALQLGDCDDTNAAASPSEPEVCDHVDNDCDSFTDEGVLVALYTDADEDGYGLPGEPAQVACREDFPELADNAEDCADEDAEIHPDVEETCDHIDQNCGGFGDEGYTERGYFDSDCDDWAPSSPLVFELCEAEVETRLPGECDDLKDHMAHDVGDCDDALSTVHFGATEVCDHLDNDCDLGVDEGDGVLVTLFFDRDGDTYGGDPAAFNACPGDLLGTSTVDGDCDDRRAVVHPNATESCDHRDADCDPSNEPWDFRGFFDADCDGFAAAGAAVVTLCGSDAPSPRYACDEPAEQFAEQRGDCDDADVAINPDAVELCDDVDNDCDGEILADEAAMKVALWWDGDQDGFGSGVSRVACAELHPEAATAGGDCDDAVAAVHPGAADLCNGRRDDDCDGEAEEDGGTPAWFDHDGDGFGGAEGFYCPNDVGFARVAGDCADNDASRHPGAVELCDTVDQDCDGNTQEVFGTRYRDDDGDGYGVGPAESGCLLDGGWAVVNGDCDDTNDEFYPGATETCDHLDGNCSGEDDPYALVGVLDRDCDGQGAEGAPTVRFCSEEVNPGGARCDQPEEMVAPVLPVADCDDANPLRISAVEEGDVVQQACDGVDNDCDGQIDEGAAGLSSSVCADAIRVQPEGDRVYLQYSGGDLSCDQAQTWCSGMGYHLWWPDQSFSTGETEVEMLASEALISDGDSVHLGLGVYRAFGSMVLRWVDVGGALRLVVTGTLDRQVGACPPLALNRRGYVDLVGVPGAGVYGDCLLGADTRFAMSVCELN